VWSHLVWIEIGPTYSVYAMFISFAEASPHTLSNHQSLSREATESKWGLSVLTWSELYTINRSFIYNAGCCLTSSPLSPSCSSFLVIRPPQAQWYISERCGSQGPLTLSFRLGLWNSAVISWRSRRKLLPGNTSSRCAQPLSLLLVDSERYCQALFGQKYTFFCIAQLSNSLSTRSLDNNNPGERNYFDFHGFIHI